MDVWEAIYVFKRCKERGGLTTVQEELKEILDNIDPSALSYEQWVHVGIAIKHEGGRMNIVEWNREYPHSYSKLNC